MKIKLLVLVTALLLVTGCADSVSFEQAAEMTPVGFLYGYWHGITFFVASLTSLFVDDVAIYAIYNSGGWYDFGFALGLVQLSAAIYTSLRKS